MGRQEHAPGAASAPTTIRRRMGRALDAFDATVDLRDDPFADRASRRRSEHHRPEARRSSGSFLARPRMGRDSHRMVITRRGTARPGTAWHGAPTDDGGLSANSGRQLRGEARRGKARHGLARRGPARPGLARRGRARPGKARPGAARPGTAWRGRARRGTEGGACGRPPLVRPRDALHCAAAGSNRRLTFCKPGP